MQNGKLFITVLPNERVSCITDLCLGGLSTNEVAHFNF